VSQLVFSRMNNKKSIKTFGPKQVKDVQHFNVRGADVRHSTYFPKCCAAIAILTPLLLQRRSETPKCLAVVVQRGPRVGKSFSLFLFRLCFICDVTILGFVTFLWPLKYPNGQYGHQNRLRLFCDDTTMISNFFPLFWNTLSTLTNYFS